MTALDDQSILVTVARAVDAAIVQYTCQHLSCSVLLFPVPIVIVSVPDPYLKTLKHGR